jgi:hypothetical protein
MQGTVSGSVRFESKGLYLISFTLGNENDSDIFEIELSDGSKQIFKSNGSSDPQRLNIILDAAAGWHTFYLKSKQRMGTEQRGRSTPVM